MTTHLTTRRLRANRWKILSAAALIIAAGSTAAPAAFGDASVVISTSSLTSAEVGLSYSAHLGVGGGTAPYRWSLAGSLPNGLSLSPSGVLSGTPKAAGANTLTIMATDSANVSTNIQLSLSIAPALSFATNTFSSPVLGQSYMANLAATGGVAPYAWSVSSGPLPLGLVLTSNGELSGIPAAVATTTTTIALTDALGARTTQSIKVSVATPSDPQAYVVASPQGTVNVYASAGATVPQTTQFGPADVSGVAMNPAGTRYWLTTRSGLVIGSPGAPDFGQLSAGEQTSSIVGIAVAPTGSGYWLANEKGHVYHFGGARSLGSLPRRRLSGHIVGIVAAPNAMGYWLVSSTGHVYAFGSAPPLAADQPQPMRHIVGMALDSNTLGAWLVSSNGRVYAFGNASTFPAPSNGQPTSVAGIAAVPSGGGYWLCTRAGTVYAYGSALSLRGIELGAPSRIAAIASAP